jgi:DNA-binding PadR family transcriptional regulator
MAPPDPKLLTREVLLGFWKVHILHHAAEDRVYGQWILTELRRHGYDISPGTLYPLLSRMERNGWLRCEIEPGGGPRGRRYYRVTGHGAAVLKILREAVVELHHEVVEEAKQSGRPDGAVRATAGRRAHKSAKTPVNVRPSASRSATRRTARKG